MKLARHDGCLALIGASDDAYLTDVADGRFSKDVTTHDPPGRGFHALTTQ